MGEQHVRTYCPLSLVSLCCLAIKRDSIHKHIKLGTLISIPDASIAQKLCEVCIKKSVIIIQKRAIFADGCFVRIIGCGYHLGKKNFLFGHYAGLRQKNITSKLKWFYSIKIQDAIKHIARNSLPRHAMNRSYHILDEVGSIRKETKFLLYSVAVWLARYRRQLGLRGDDIRGILKMEKKLKTVRNGHHINETMWKS